MGTSSSSASTFDKTLILQRGAVSSLIHGGVSYAHPCGDAAFIVNPLDDLTIVFARLPWWETPPLATFPRAARGLCYIPFQGWKNDVWHDGPLVRLNASGDVMAWVAMGGTARLETPLDSAPGVAFAACLERLAAWEGDAAKISLTQALRARCGEVSQLALLLTEYDEREAVLCALLRRAYPDATLVAPEGPLSPPWRRLLQNLGILHGRAPLPSGLLEHVMLSDLRDFLPVKHLTPILGVLQRRSDLIPPRLLDAARSAPKSSRAEDCARAD